MIETKQNEKEDTLILQEDIEYDDSDYQVSPDEVKNFLEDSSKQVSSESEIVKERLDKAEAALVSLVGEAENTDTEEEQDKDEERVHIAPDTTFQAPTKYFTEMSFNIRDDQHKITDDEKEAYLEAMLSNSQLELPIAMSNKITIVCRDLNVYERDLSINAIRNFADVVDTTPQAVLLQMRKYRIPMQIISINGKKFDTLKFTYDNNYDLKTFEQDTEKLKAEANNRVMHLSVSLQGLLNKAVNIFEHKLARLEEAAFNQDFWNPVGRD